MRWRRCWRWPASCTAAACRRCARARRSTSATCTTTWRASTPPSTRIRDTIGTAIQVNLSMVTIEESETTKRLAAWAGDLRRVHRAGRHLGHELRAHARAEVGLGLPAGAGPDRHRRRPAVLALPAGRLAVTMADATPAPRPRRPAAAGAAGRGAGAARQAEDLLRRLGRRRQDLRDAGRGARRAGRRARRWWSAWSRRMAAPRPRPWRATCRGCR